MASTSKMHAHSSARPEMWLAYALAFGYHHKNNSKEVISGMCFGTGIGSSCPFQQFSKALRDSGTSTLQCGVGSSLPVDVSWFLDG